MTHGQASTGTSSGDDPEGSTLESLASDELVASAEVLARIRQVLEERRARRSDIPPPQALLPLDADEVEPLEFYPWRRTIGARAPVRVDDLLLAAPETFVARCYRLLLLRNPKASEARWQATFRPEKWARLVLIARLHWSEEGRQAAVPLSGIDLHLVPGCNTIARRLGSPFRRAP